MQHSNEVREFLITSKGLDLVEVYRGPNGVLVGSARKAKLREELTLCKKESIANILISLQKDHRNNMVQEKENMRISDYMSPAKLLNQSRH